MATKFGLTVFNGKLTTFFKLKILSQNHVTLYAWNAIARRDFHFLLFEFAAVLLELNRILDGLIIQFVWYILKQLFGEN